MHRFIFVTGGVVSSLGKGIAASALAALLQARGYSVRVRKLDPYLNIDPGTMSPIQHGEVFVTEDGSETDLDLGHYERFTGVNALKSDSTTTGRIYSNVIEKERRGDYLGATVQVVPHIIEEIKSFIYNEADQHDFIICEIGGTVGDIEAFPFLEAIRQVANDIGRKNVLYIHLTLIPYIDKSSELKTKPTQHSVKELQRAGIQPNILICRTKYSLSAEVRSKIGLFCNIDSPSVIEAQDVNNIYEVPLVYHKEGLDVQVCAYFGLPFAPPPNLSKWTNIVKDLLVITDTIEIGVVGKYVQLPDAYKSLIEAIAHGALVNNVRVNIKWVDVDNIENQDIFDNLHGILVPGGFGIRGIEGKLTSITYARINKVPFFGICLGMQLAVIEIMRSLAGLKDASSTEFVETGAPVIAKMIEWMDGKTLQNRLNETNMGGTMRLGAYPCKLDNDSKVFEIYQQDLIHERHRHRYEVNSKYIDTLIANDVRIAGISPDGELVEIIEYKPHPWFIGVQFHPELKSRPFDPHPLFVSFIKAAIKYKESKK